MRSLYLRIWLTVVLALAAFAVTGGWLVQRHLRQERDVAAQQARQRIEAWADMLQRSLPGAQADPAEQAAALEEWSHRLRLPMALDAADGRRIHASQAWQRREARGPREGDRPPIAIDLDDGRRLWIWRGGPRRFGPPGEDHHRGPPDGFRGRDGQGSSGVSAMPEAPGALGTPGGIQATDASGATAATAAPGASPVRPSDAALAREGPFERPPPDRHRGPPPPLPWKLALTMSSGVGLAALLAGLFVAVAVGAYPVVRRLTRRLEAMKQGVEAFGEGDLQRRVDASGRDEVASVGRAFNEAAERIASLIASNRNLLANASHELRSPLARLKMALTMLDEMPEGPERAKLRRELDVDIAELDALVEEVLLASRLEAGAGTIARDPVDLTALAAEEAARVGAQVAGPSLTIHGDEKLIRRAIRNLLENARRYGAGAIDVTLTRGAADAPSAAMQAPPSAERAQRADRVGVGSARGTSQGAIELRVCDQGPGVPPALRERIFEPFFRLPGHAEREGGVGLGLALVRQIAQRHGGQVRCVDPEPPGHGSCFVLTLPG